MGGGNRKRNWGGAHGHTLWTWSAIAEALGVSPNTAKKYAHHYGFPVARLAGHVVSSRGLIDLWLLELARHPQGGKDKMRGTGKGRNA